MKSCSTVPGSGPCAWAASAVLAMSVIWTQPASAETNFELELKETGKRDYYCTATFALTAQASAAFQDVNGYFYVFVDDDQVGRSKGASFRFGDGEASASAVFETPNAPCDEVNGYRFVVGACMRGNSFMDRAACASAITPVAPVQEITAR